MKKMFWIYTFVLSKITKLEQNKKNVLDIHICTQRNYEVWAEIQLTFSTFRLFFPPFTGAFFSLAGGAVTSANISGAAPSFFRSVPSPPSFKASVFWAPLSVLLAPLCGPASRLSCPCPVTVTPSFSFSSSRSGRRRSVPCSEARPSNWRSSAQPAATARSVVSARCSRASDGTEHAAHVLLPSAHGPQNTCAQRPYRRGSEATAPQPLHRSRASRASSAAPVRRQLNTSESAICWQDQEDRC